MPSGTAPLTDLLNVVHQEIFFRSDRKWLFIKLFRIEKSNFITLKVFVFTLYFTPTSIFDITICNSDQWILTHELLLSFLLHPRLTRVKILPSSPEFACARLLVNMNAKLNFELFGWAEVRFYPCAFCPVIGKDKEGKRNRTSSNFGRTTLYI